MNKLFKILTASIMLIAMLVISGCGGGDKFAGNWVTQEKNMAVKFKLYSEIFVQKQLRICKKCSNQSQVCG